MTSQRTGRAWARAAGGAVAGTILGVVLGSGWFALFGSDADPLGAIPAALAGAVAGGVAVGAWGWSLPCWLAAPPLPRLGAVLGWILCGTLLVVGIVYIGGWTDSDGPNAEAVVGILGIPISTGVVWLIARLLRSRLPDRAASRD